LPRTVLMYPMTLASQAAHLVMLLQQNIAEVANKGDSTLETLFPPKDEQPEWATFDEDLDDDATDGSAAGTDPTAANGERRTDGRFALYSTTEGQSDAEQPPAAPVAAPTATTPAVVTDLDYPALTLAQLRARLSSLSPDELAELLAYEEATKARAPFQTLLANRITRATTK
ncbi:MAG TPA: lipid droplet-associated protein, partial [Mycobacterium sp.]|nr:lipid droplet-associated protein [Mycobacterium sp.]